jgi:hypothetical protein
MTTFKNTYITQMHTFNIKSIASTNKEDKEKSRKGLCTQMRELASYMIIDNTLMYKYKYENSDFIKLKRNQTPDNFMKFILKKIDCDFDFVSNDLEVKSFNGLKTFVTENTKLLKFFMNFSKAKPLQLVGLITKRLEGFLPKQKEFYNLTGANKNYTIIKVFYNKKTNSSTFSNIFMSFSLLKEHVFNTITNLNDQDLIKLIKILFVKSIMPHKHKIILGSGFFFKVNNRKIRHFFKIFKEMSVFDKKISRLIKTRHKRKKFILLRKNSKYPLKKLLHNNNNVKHSIKFKKLRKRNMQHIARKFTLKKTNVQRWIPVRPVTLPKYYITNNKKMIMHKRNVKHPKNAIMSFTNIYGAQK